MSAIITQEHKETVAMLVNKIFLNVEIFFLFTRTFFYRHIKRVLCYRYKHNYIKILETDWSSAGLISALIVQLHTSCACNCTVIHVMPE